MGFLNSLKQFDTDLLLNLNNNYSDFWDGVMFISTDTLLWMPMFLAILYVIIKNKGRESILIITLLILSLAIDDNIANLLKSGVERLRPTHDPSLMFDIHTVNSYRGGLYSFVSSHASNSFGIAIFLALLIRNFAFTLTIFLWASFHSYTRIYLGVHYPFDILGGMAIGLLIGYIFYKLHGFLLTRFHLLKAVGFDKNNLSHTSSGFELKSVYLMSLMILLSFVFILLVGTKLLAFL